MGMNMPGMKDQSTISFFVANNMNKVEMTNEIKLLLPFLKEKLNHYGIKIETDIKEQKKTEGVSDGAKLAKFIIAAMVMHSGIVTFFP